MILGYKKEPNSAPYWFGKVDGQNRKFCRVIVGAAFALQDRQAGAVVAFGQLYQSFGPLDLTLLAVDVGDFGRNEAALYRFKKDLKFSDIVVDSDDTRDLLWRMQNGLMYGTGEVQPLSHLAPPPASAEIGRQQVQALIDQDRLHGMGDDAPLRMDLDNEPDQVQRAVQYAVCWALNEPVVYASRKSGPLALQNPAGTVGL